MLTVTQKKEAAHQLAMATRDTGNVSMSATPSKKVVDPNAPKKPPSNFMIFLKKRRMEL